MHDENQNEMTLNDYQMLAGRTMPAPGHQHWVEDCYPRDRSDLDRHLDLLHAALGMTGEAGEVADYIKKCMYYGKPLDEMKLREEVGDIIWYIAGPLCRALDCTLEDIARQNIDKLKTRYPLSYSDRAAIERIDVDK